MKCRDIMLSLIHIFSYIKGNLCFSASKINYHSYRHGSFKGNRGDFHSHSWSGGVYRPVGGGAGKNSMPCVPYHPSGGGGPGLRQRGSCHRHQQGAGDRRSGRCDEQPCNRSGRYIYSGIGASYGDAAILALRPQIKGKGVKHVKTGACDI